MKTRTTYFIYFLLLFLSAHIRPISTSCHPLNSITTSTIRCNEPYPEFQGNLYEGIPFGNLISSYEDDDENEFSSFKKKPSVSCINTPLNTFVCLYGNPVCLKQPPGCNCTSSATKKYIFQRVLKI
jgi:hypothetical protein